MHLVRVATVVDEMDAPADRIFRVLKGVAEGHGGDFEWAEVLPRTDNRLLCDFWTEIRLPLGHTFRFPTREPSSSIRRTGCTIVTAADRRAALLRRSASCRLAGTDRG